MTKARNIADLGSNDVIETSATGVDVTGTVSADGLTIEGSEATISSSTFKGFKVKRSDVNVDQVLYLAPVADTVGSYLQNNASYATSFQYTPETTASSGIEFDKDGDLFFRADDGLTVGTNFLPTNRMRIQPNGDVSFYEDTGTTAKFVWDSSAESLGIGTASPNRPVHLGGSGSRNYFKAETTAATSSDEAGLDIKTATANWLIHSKGDARDLIVYDAASTSERMRIDSSGRVGIGTSSPSAKLDSHDNGASVRATRASNTDQYIELAGGDGAGLSHINANYQMAFKTGNSERMRLDSSGNLLVGTTSAESSGGVTVRGSTSSSVATLHVNGGTTNQHKAITCSTGQLSSSHGTILVGTSNPGNGYFVSFSAPDGSYNYANRGAITLSGTSVLYSNLSDQRLKENIKDTTHTVDINDIRVREFDWKGDGSHQRFGFIAQELETVYPEAVHSPENPDEMKSVDYSKLVPLLVKEIQTLKARIETLENN